MVKSFFLIFIAAIVGLGNTAFGQKYVSLGLPSGTKWSTENEEGHFSYGKAVDNFRNTLPSCNQWEELMRECKWTWEEGKTSATTGYKVTGPNGKSIFLPAAGFHYSNDTTAQSVDFAVFYWSSTPYDNASGAPAWLLKFTSNEIWTELDEKDYRLSVRLVNDSKKMDSTVKPKFVNLGLPSGTKWKTVNEKYEKNGKSYDNATWSYGYAMGTFLNRVPSLKQWEELIRECKWTWVEGKTSATTGYKVTGPNGKSIFLPAAGAYFPGCGEEYVGTHGWYWSNEDYGSCDRCTAWHLIFSDEEVWIEEGSKKTQCPVRLVKDSKSLIY